MKLVKILFTILISMAFIVSGNTVSNYNDELVITLASDLLNPLPEDFNPADWAKNNANAKYFIKIGEDRHGNKIHRDGWIQHNDRTLLEKSNFSRYPIYFFDINQHSNLERLDAVYYNMYDKVTGKTLAPQYTDFILDNEGNIVYKNEYSSKTMSSDYRTIIFFENIGLTRRNPINPILYSNDISVKDYEIISNNSNTAGQLEFIRERNINPYDDWIATRNSNPTAMSRSRFINGSVIETSLRRYTVTLPALGPVQTLKNFIRDIESEAPKDYKSILDSFIYSNGQSKINDGLTVSEIYDRMFMNYSHYMILPIESRYAMDNRGAIQFLGIKGELVDGTIIDPEIEPFTETVSDEHGTKEVYSFDITFENGQFTNYNAIYFVGLGVYSIFDITLSDLVYYEKEEVEEIYSKIYVYLGDIYSAREGGLVKAGDLVSRHELKVNEPYAPTFTFKDLDNGLVITATDDIKDFNVRVRYEKRDVDFNVDNPIGVNVLNSEGSYGIDINFPENIKPDNESFWSKLFNKLNTGFLEILKILGFVLLAILIIFVIVKIIQLIIPLLASFRVKK